MALVSLHDGIVFIEGDHPRAIKKTSAETRVGGFGAQFRNLNDLKSQMAYTAKTSGCNCVVNFNYGQKTKLIAIDDVAYVGSGWYSVLSPDDYNSIVSQFR